MGTRAHLHDVLSAHLREILFKAWDPLDVNSNPRLYCEYDDYNDRLIDLRTTEQPVSRESVMRLVRGLTTPSSRTSIVNQPLSSSIVPLSAWYQRAGSCPPEAQVKEPVITR